MEEADFQRVCGFVDKVGSDLALERRCRWGEEVEGVKAGGVDPALLKCLQTDTLEALRLFNLLSRFVKLMSGLDKWRHSLWYVDYHRLEICIPETLLVTSCRFRVCLPHISPRVGKGYTYYDALLEVGPALQDNWNKTYRKLLDADTVRDVVGTIRSAVLRLEWFRQEPETKGEVDDTSGTD